MTHNKYGISDNDCTTCLNCSEYYPYYRKRCPKCLEDNKK